MQRYARLLRDHPAIFPAKRAFHGCSNGSALPTQFAGRRIVYQAFVQEFDWERERRLGTSIGPFGGAGFRVADFRCCGRSKVVQERPEITARSIASAAEKSIASHARSRDFSWRIATKF